MIVSAQVSLYPLAQTNINPAIDAFIAALTEHGLTCTVGPMSTVVVGDDEAVLAAVREGYRRAVAHGPAVLQVTLSNACPLPGTGALPAGEGDPAAGEGAA